MTKYYKSGILYVFDYYYYIEVKEMEKIIEILNRVRDDIDYENETALVDDGILDSFDIVGIVSELIAEFDIEISIDDMTAENFNSVEAIDAMVNRILDEF